MNEHSNSINASPLLQNRFCVLKIFSVSVSQTVCRGVRESLQNAFGCYKYSAKIDKMLPLQVTLREVMIFFLEISTIWGCITRFPKTVAQKSGDLQKKLKKRLLLLSLSPVMPLDINWNRFQGWGVAKFVHLISCVGRQKSLGPLFYVVMLLVGRVLTCRYF